MPDETKHFYDCLKNELANTLTRPGQQLDTVHTSIDSTGLVTSSTVQNEDAYEINSGTWKPVENHEAITINAPHGPRGPISISSSSHVKDPYSASESAITFTDNFDGTTSSVESGNGEFSGVAASTAADQHISARNAVDICKAPAISSIRLRSSTPS